MKLNSRNYFKHIGLAVILSVLFAGCKSAGPTPPTSTDKKTPQPKEATQPVLPKTMPADAKEAIKQAVENIFSAKSLSSEMVINIEMMGMKMASNFDVTKYDNLNHTTGEFMGMRRETYSDGKNTVIKESMNNKWKLIPTSQKDLASSKDLMTSLEKMSRKLYQNSVNEAKFAGDEKIDNINCAVIEASIKPEGLQEMVANQGVPIPQEMGVSFNKITLKMWIDKKNCLAYKSVLSIETTISGEVPGLPHGDTEDSGDKKDIEEEEDTTTPSDSHAEGQPSEGDANHNMDMTKTNYKIEMNYFDYNKVEPMVLPDEVKKILDTAATTPNTEEKPPKEPTNK